MTNTEYVGGAPCILDVQDRENMLIVLFCIKGFEAFNVMLEITQQ